MAKTKKNAARTLILLDAHAIIHRAYHALPDFASTKGEPTGGLYGVVTMLLKIIDEFKPDYLAACFDLAETTFRKEAYGDYKAGRKKADPALVAQLIRARDLFTAFGIPIYDQAGFEADDIIGTIAAKTKELSDLKVIIASGDMDTMQLVEDDRVTVYTLKKGLSDTILYNEEKMIARFGFAPALLADFKGLRGDPSDNIIGIAGIGEKTATTLIQTFGSIEKMYQALAKSEEKFKTAGLTDRVIKLLKDGEEEALFSKMLATIRRDAPIDFTLPALSWRETFKSELVENLFRELEFKSLIPRVKLLAVAQGGQVAETAQASADATGLDPEEIKKIGIAMWLVNSELTMPTLEDILEYAGTDSFAAAQEKVMADLKEGGLEKIYHDIELPLLPIIKKAEERGILIDRAHLLKLSEDYHRELSALEQKIFALAGREFNLNSPKQLGEILFDEMQISTKGLKKTAGGARSTRESELEKLREENPIIADILQYREFQKLLSTYVDNIPQMLDSGDRLHTTLHQAGTTTGRMSSTNPNLQNIPNRGERGVEIRNAFIASPGYKLLAFDYSQIDLRALALLSGDHDLVKIFKDGRDIHTAVAAKVFGVTEKEVTKEMRRQAKVINFGIIYGMGVNALKQNLGTSRDEAQKFYDNYFATFPTISKYFDTVVSTAYRKGYTETYFGRRRYFPGLKSKLPFIRASAERMAMNAPLQGTTADLVKIASIRVDELLRKKKLEDKVVFLLQIHDELLYEAEEGVVEKIAPLIEKTMEEVITESIPLAVHHAQGVRWGEME